MQHAMDAHPPPCLCGSVYSTRMFQWDTSCFGVEVHRRRRVLLSTISMWTFVSIVTAKLVDPSNPYRPCASHGMNHPYSHRSHSESAAISGPPGSSDAGIGEDRLFWLCVSPFTMSRNLSLVLFLNVSLRFSSQQKNRSAPKK